MSDESRFLWGGASSVSLDQLQHGTSFGGRLSEFSGRTALIATADQLAAGLALIELDGVAGRVIICPPDLSPDQLRAVLAKSGVDAIVSDHEPSWRQGLDIPLHVVGSCSPIRAEPGRIEYCATEWVLLTSGTSGMPKMIQHSLASLAAPIHTGEHQDAGVVWGTFYDIRRYGGLQIFLRALLGGGSLVLSGASEPVGDFLLRLAAHGVTHVSGTPSHWRRALMSPHAAAIAPQCVRLSGEIVDQGILNALRAFYPKARVSHAFASTEAGVGFEVTDGLEGFPADVVGAPGEVEVKIADGSLHLRSTRTAARYLDGKDGVLADAEGFVDTGDMVELRGGRYYFLGRRNGVINIGGMKVYPEEIEAVINRHPAVRMSMVWSKRNPITGAVVTADVVLKPESQPSIEESRITDCKREILHICRESLAAHKVPAIIRCVPALAIAAAGKMARPHA